jgi:tRNA threonylcarbamoyladenosine biosynthesis protein TsaE
MLEKILNSTQDCEKLGCYISQKIQRGDVISLEGELGSGKTTFVKGILKGLNYTHDVTSPTFTLVNEYDADIKVIHIDFYRENNVARWENIGINEYYNRNHIVIIEWGNLIDSLLPDDVITISFEYVDFDKRKITSSYEPFSN